MNKITKNNDTLYWWEKNLLQIHVLQSFSSIMIPLATSGKRGLVQFLRNLPQISPYCSISSQFVNLHKFVFNKFLILCVFCFLQDFSHLWAFRASQTWNTRVLVPHIITSRQHCETWYLVVALGSCKKKKKNTYKKSRDKWKKPPNNKNHRKKPCSLS